MTFSIDVNSNGYTFLKRVEEPPNAGGLPGLPEPKKKKPNPRSSLHKFRDYRLPSTPNRPYIIKDSISRLRALFDAKGAQEGDRTAELGQKIARRIFFHVAKCPDKNERKVRSQRLESDLDILLFLLFNANLDPRYSRLDFMEINRRSIYTVAKILSLSESTVKRFFKRYGPEGLGFIRTVRRYRNGVEITARRFITFQFLAVIAMQETVKALLRKYLNPKKWCAPLGKVTAIVHEKSIAAMSKILLAPSADTKPDPP